MPVITLSFVAAASKASHGKSGVNLCMSRSSRSRISLLLPVPPVSSSSSASIRRGEEARLPACGYNQSCCSLTIIQIDEGLVQVYIYTLIPNKIIVGVVVVVMILITITVIFK